MHEQLETDWLDAKLRDEASYVDDGGFTARVVAKLPTARTRRSLRAVILIGMALLASALAYSLSGGGRFVWEAIAHASLLSAPLMFAIMGAVGVLVTGAGLYAAITRTDATLT